MIEQESESAILVGLCTDSRRRGQAEESLLELRELIFSAGARVADIFYQEREKADPAYLIGEGKLYEVRDTVFGTDADLVVFDDELTPAQLRNLEEVIGVKVLDRSELILDIFAQRARSKEGKLQVELAQLEYLLPRLTGRGASMSRLGGGIGTRGPGETKLEVDRRRVRRRISRVKEDLERLEARRELHRSRRRSVPIPTVSLVGYTNAGKSTLFTRLTEQETFVSSRMFATLDPLVRKISLPSGQEVLLSDTVGFIRKLPHTLVAAFHATLEETLESDLLLHVVDVSQSHFEELRASVFEVLEEIGVVDIPVLEVYNKIDQIEELPPVSKSRESTFTSALTGEGVEGLVEKIEEVVSRDYRDVTLMIPFGAGDVLNALRERARVQATEYRPDGVHVEASLRSSDIGRFREFLNV